MNYAAEHSFMDLVVGMCKMTDEKKHTSTDQYLMNRLLYFRKCPEVEQILIGLLKYHHVHLMSIDRDHMLHLAVDNGYVDLLVMVRSWMTFGVNAEGIYYMVVKAINEHPERYTAYTQIMSVYDTECAVSGIVQTIIQGDMKHVLKELDEYPYSIISEVLPSLMYIGLFHGHFDMFKMLYDLAKEKKNDPHIVFIRSFTTHPEIATPELCGVVWSVLHWTQKSV